MNDTSAQTPTELASVSYDAFISYRHNAIDSAAAHGIQQGLEHFHTSLLSRKDRTPINRVFMDEGELSSSADFELRLRDALRNAKWLIVICSTRLQDSPWVNLEIETFLETHDRNHILAVLTDGEPEDVYPHALSEMSHLLAADARGATRNEVLRKIRGDVIMKLAAPILGTTFDSLKQRRKLYVMRRAMAVGSVVGVCLLAFALYISWQALQIRRQYNASRRNQARYLASISEDLSNEGRKDDALLTALAVQPADDSDGPVVPEQLYALNTALNSYKAGNLQTYDADHIGDCVNPQSGELSEDGAFYCAVNEDQEACILDGETGELLWKITMADVQTMLDPSHEYSDTDLDRGILRVIPISGSRAVLCLRRCLILADLKEQSLTKEYYLGDLDEAAALTPSPETGDQTETDYLGNTYCELGYYSTSSSIRGICCAEDSAGETRIAFFSDSSSDAFVYVLNLDTGSLVKKYCFSCWQSDDNRLPGMSYEVSALAWSASGDQLAIGLSGEYLDSDFSSAYDISQLSENQRTIYEQHRDSWLAEHEAGEVVVWDLSDGADVNSRTTALGGRIISQVPASDLSFVGEDRLICVHQPESDTSGYQDSFGVTACTEYAALYDLSDDRILWQGADFTCIGGAETGFLPISLTVNDRQTDCVGLWVDKSFTVLRASDGNVVTSVNYQSSIVGASAYDSHRLMISLSSGALQLLILNDTFSMSQLMKLSLTDLASFDFSDDTETVILRSSDSIFFCGKHRDENLKEIDINQSPAESAEASETSPASSDTGEDLTIDSISYVTLNGISYRCVQADTSDSVLYPHGLIIYPSGSDEPVFRYVCDSDSKSIRNIGYGSDSSDSYVAFIEEEESGSDSEDSLVMVRASLTTGRILTKAELPCTISPDSADGHNDSSSLYGCRLLWTKESLGTTYSADLSEFYVTYEDSSEDGDGRLIRTAGILAVDITGDSVTLPAEPIFGTAPFAGEYAMMSAADGSSLPVYSFHALRLTGDGRYLAILWNAADADSDWYDSLDQYELSFYDTETGEIRASSEPLSFTSAPSSDCLVSGLTSSRICLNNADVNGSLYVADASDGSVQVLDLSAGGSIHIGFFDGDRFLVVGDHAHSCVKMIDLSSGQTVFNYSLPDAQDMVSLYVYTGESSSYLVLADESYSVSYSSDSGFRFPKILICSVDEDHRIYPYAVVQNGRMDFTSLEISTKQGSSLYYSSIYDYAELKEKALKHLDGRTLSDEQKTEYFVED